MNFYQKLRLRFMTMGMTLDRALIRRGITTDADYPKDPNPKNWRTISGAHVHLDNNGNYDGGAGGKFNGAHHWGGPDWKQKGQKVSALTSLLAKLASKKSAQATPPATPKNVASQGTTSAGNNGTIKTKEEIINNIAALQQEYERLKQKPNNAIAATEAHKKLQLARIDAAKKGVILHIDESVYGKDSAKEIEKRFANCPEAVRVIWNLYGDGIKQNTTFTGIAYASAGGREVYYNLNEIKNGKSHKEPYETYFHENGHAMDYLANSGSSVLPYSATYNNGEFIKAIQNDVDELIKNAENKIKPEFKAHVASGDIDWLQKNGYIPSYVTNLSGPSLAYYLKFRKAFVYSYLRKEIIKSTVLQPGNKKGLGTLSDILAGATNFKIFCGIDHGNTYWKKRTYAGMKYGLATEALAGFTGAHATNPENLKNLRKYLPNTSKIFDKMMIELAQKEEARYLT